MHDTALIQLLTQKTGATLGEEFSVTIDDRIILDRDLTHKVVNLYLQGDVDFKPLISQIWVEADDKLPDFFTRSIYRTLTRCCDLCKAQNGWNVASLYFYLFYAGVALKFAVGEDLPYSLFYALTGRPLDLAAAVRDSPDLGWLFSLVFEDVVQSVVDVRITSVERYRQLVEQQAWLEYWQMPN